LRHRKKQLYFADKPANVSANDGSQREVDHEYRMEMFTAALAVRGLEIYKYKKVKQSRNRPGVARRVPVRLGSHISMTFGT
jgi:hypothetical protein